MDNFSDTPITKPEKDRFGFDTFAKAVSDCIRGICEPDGSVVAIYGPWGSGKSSAINLVLHHLHNSRENIDVIKFPAWIYRNEDALVSGFFRELYAGLSPVLSKRTQAAVALRKLGANFAGAGNLAGAAVGLFAGSFFEKVTTAILDTCGYFIKPAATTEDLQTQLADVLRQEQKRFLIVIDDLDRLAPEEALVIFRLVKSVGRLPNVMYLLAYDRNTTEKAVAERFPSEGHRYLEKIVQAGFELPNIDQPRLSIMMSEYLDDINPGSVDTDPPELASFFHSVIVPELKTPRDVIRLANTLSIVANPVENDVFFPDLMSLETFRVFRPRLYQAIRANKLDILNVFRTGPHDGKNEKSKEFSQRLLESEAESDHKRLKKILMYLFPQLRIIFTGEPYSEKLEWRQQRRVCSREHFDTYFRFVVSPESIPGKELDYLLDNKRTIEDIRKRFIEAIEVTQAKNQSKARYLLDELIVHGKNIPISQTELILSAIFPIADKIMDGDKKMRTLFGDNRWRIHLLLQAFLFDRTTIEQRSGILVRSMKETPLRWLSDFSRLAWEEHYPRYLYKEARPEKKTMLTKEDAEVLRERARSQINAAAIDGTLIDTADLGHILYEWDVLKADDSDEVRRFTADAIADDQKIIKLARAIDEKSFRTDTSTIDKETEDMSSHEFSRIPLNYIESFLNYKNFQDRLRSLSDNPFLSEEDRNLIKKF